MEYTEKDYQEDLKISNYVFCKYFKKFVTYKQDLIQESLIGLWKTRLKFDESRGKLSTFKTIVSITYMRLFLRKERKHLNNLLLECDLKKVGDNGELLELFDVFSNDEINIEKIDLYDEILNVLGTKKKTFIDIVKFSLSGYNQTDVSKIKNCSQAKVSRVLKRFKNDLCKQIEKW